MKIGWTGWVAGSLLGFCAMPAAAQTAPSFDCARAATAIEKAICADPDLARADATMGRLFAAARVSAFGTGPSNIMPEQVAALAERARCARSGGSLRECLMSWYEARNAELAVAALFAEPDLALALLRHADPEYATLYEAIHRYASHPNGTDWTSPAMAAERRRMEALLAPAFGKLQSDDARSYGRDILHDAVGNLDDATASEENFARTIKILAAYAEGKTTPMTMPCAALVRHPGLQEATYPEFGSTLDVGIPVSDCDATLPPLPRLDALVAQVLKSWPTCEGSIRFSAYRWFGVTQDNARLRSDQGKPRATLPRLAGVQPAQVNAAIAELADYYRQYRHLGPAAARSAVGEILDDAHKCGDEE